MSSARVSKEAVRLLTGWVAVVVLACAGGCRQTNTGQQGKERKPTSWRPLNVVLVTIDTLRADRVGCYGYSAAETPNLDQLAKRGVVFENAIAQVPLTPPSHASMFTGVYPPVHQVRDVGGFSLGSSHPTLAKVLAEKGWTTAAFVGSAVLKRGFGLHQGFQTYDDRIPEPDVDSPARGHADRPATEVVDLAIQWLVRQDGRKPVFLWVHLYDPHAPYQPPSPFKERFGRRAYDGEIAYADSELGKLMAACEKRGLLQDGVFAVLSDHGESLGEHGEFSHGVFLYDATLRIPWIIAGTGIPAGKRIGDQARTIDLLPTLLDLVGGEIPADCQGVSLTPTFSGKPVQTEFAYAETLFPKINMGWAELRAIRTTRWKYVLAPRPELYDLQFDPEETSNVVEQHPQEVANLKTRLLKLLPGEGTTERVVVGKVEPELEKQLRSLGYLSGGSSQQLLLTGQGIDPKDRLEILKLVEESIGPHSQQPSARRLELLRQAVRQDPTNPVLYLLLGDGLEKHGLWKEALALYESALRYQGGATSKVYVRIARILGRQNRIPEAIAAFQKAVELDPNDTKTLNKLAVTCLLVGRTAEAQGALEALLFVDPHNAEALNSLGWLALKRKDSMNARDYFERALKANPEFLEPHINLGMLCKQQGDYECARIHFEAFLSKASSKVYRDSIPRVKSELAMLQRTARGTVQ
ncbi:MAG: sulfatase-like hydrolase/transferase [Acidobacteriota bacterium]